ncbi:hypothetical protein AVEN_56033-1 [Araneus ventricosus]|uniref:Uncharacterized protein n=1 Tax=Araneus ventricosus TaxID=182803 RepID=A0A4Y2DLN5_ARAVE|nr:hypothetical protein AVEN_56033-1 [Araneus ventricosus]
MTSRHDFICHCGPCIIVPITSGSCGDSPPLLSGYDPSSEMGPESHTTITIPTREARIRLLIRWLLNRELAVPAGGIGKISKINFWISHILNENRKDLRLDSYNTRGISATLIVSIAVR